MMVKSTFISIGIHIFLIMFAYFGLPSFKVKEPIELPIDIVEDTPISSKTSLKLGDKKVKEVKKIKKVTTKEEFKKTLPPPLPSKKTIAKKNIELKKKKEIKKVAELIKKNQNLRLKKLKKHYHLKLKKSQKK